MIIIIITEHLILRPKMQANYKADIFHCRVENIPLNRATDCKAAVSLELGFDLKVQVAGHGLMNAEMPCQEQLRLNDKNLRFPGASARSERNTRRQIL